LSENSEKGIIQGNTTHRKEVLSNVDVTLKNKQGAELKTKTNQYGFFKMELIPDYYEVTFRKENVQSEPIGVELKSGMTYPINHDFEKIG
jgi:phosphatidate phosphatase APP1